MPQPPERYKRPEDLSPDEIIKQRQAARRGRPLPRPETPEYIAYRADALRAAGLEEEAAASEAQHRPPSGVEEHLQAIKRPR